MKNKYRKGTLYFIYYFQIFITYSPFEFENFKQIDSSDKLII